MNIIEDFQEGLQYTDDIKNAVRYGYRYRKEAIKYENEHYNVHACLEDSSEILLWLANLVIGGAAWDLIKVVSKKLYKQLTAAKAQIDKEPYLVLSDEEELKLFYEYVKEFNEQCLTVTEMQFKYIREEVVADYCGNESQKIFDQYKRQPTIEEIIRIHREADAYADKIMKPSE